MRLKPENYKRIKRRAKKATAQAETTVTGGDDTITIYGEFTEGTPIAYTCPICHYPWYLVPTLYYEGRPVCPVCAAKFSTRKADNADYVTDGFGCYAMRICPHCGGTRQVVRPGDIRCGECGR